MSDIVQRFGRNPRGRDFVVGDIHGCFDALRRELCAVNFAAETDRLFCVGDLIDRGPQSAETLAWLDEPWLHSCLGNHEEMALQSEHDERIRVSWQLFNGGEWWIPLEPAVRLRHLSAFRQLPLAMEVETTRGRVGIVHADVPDTLSWPAFVAALESGDVATRDAALWSRRRADGLVKDPVQGIERIVCGHTIASDRRIHVSANVWFVDTGAFLAASSGGHLTLLELESLFQNDGAAAGPLATQ